MAVLLWDWVGTRVGGPRAGTLPHLPLLTQQPIGGRSWTKHARGRWLGKGSASAPSRWGCGRGAGGHVGPSWISAPDTSPQSPMARPPAAAALQDSGPGKVSLPGVLAYGSVPSRTLRTGVPSGHILVTVCPLVTHLVPPMNLSSGSHLTRSSPSQGTFWRRPSSLGGNWCRVPQMWSPMKTWPESEKGPTSWAALRGHCLCPRSSHTPPCF